MKEKYICFYCNKECTLGTNEFSCNKIPELGMFLSDDGLKIWDVYKGEILKFVASSIFAVYTEKEYKTESYHAYPCLSEEIIDFMDWNISYAIKKELKERKHLFKNKGKE